jgi:hypothetical protein
METEKFAGAEAPVVTFEEVRETVRQSREIDKLIEALAKAQGEFEPIVKDTTNPFFKNKYADLATIIASTKVALSKYGLSVLQPPLVDAHTAGVRTILAHASGQYISTDLMLPAAQGSKFDCQTVGSALTYARRYALQAILGVAADVDEDGNLAAGNNGSKGAAQDVAKAQLEEKAKSPDPKVAAIAKEGLAKINAVNTAKDLEGTLKASLDAQKDEGLFDEVSGVILGVRKLQTSKGAPYRKIAMTVFENGNPKDIEINAFDNFKMSDTGCFAALDAVQANDTAALIIERSGKYLNLKDIKQLGSKHWDARLAVVSANRS